MPQKNGSFLRELMVLLHKEYMILWLEKIYIDIYTMYASKSHASHPAG